jgi:hypothetical protein
LFGERTDDREVGVDAGSDEEQQDGGAAAPRGYAAAICRAVCDGAEAQRRYEGWSGSGGEPESEGTREDECAGVRSNDPWEVLPAIKAREKEIGKRVECIAIDEGQFVDGLFAFTHWLLDANHDVLVAGLDLDFRAIPFGEMLNLSWFVTAYGGSVTECIAYCACGNPGFLLAAADRRATCAI